MTDFEKAIRYLCLFETDDMEIMAGRYLVIQDIVQGDLEEEKKYAKKYEKMVDILCFQQYNKYIKRKRGKEYD